MRPCMSDSCMTVPPQCLGLAIPPQCLNRRDSARAIFVELRSDGDDLGGPWPPLHLPRSGLGPVLVKVARTKRRHIVEMILEPLGALEAIDGIAPVDNETNILRGCPLVEDGLDLRSVFVATAERGVEVLQE